MKYEEVLHIFEVEGCDMCRKKQKHEGKVVFGVHPLKVREIYNVCCIERVFRLCRDCFKEWKIFITMILKKLELSNVCQISSSPEFELDKGCWITFIDGKGEVVRRFQTNYSCFKKIYRMFSKWNGLFKEAKRSIERG